jgi:hypothetical protein
LCLAGEHPNQDGKHVTRKLIIQYVTGGKRYQEKQLKLSQPFQHHTSLCHGASGWLSLSSYRSRVRSTSNKEKRLKCKQAECRPIKDPGSVVWPQSFPIAPCSTLPNAELGPAMLQKDCARIQAGRPSQQIKSQDMA